MAINGVISYKGTYPFGIEGIEINYNVGGSVVVGSLFEQTKKTTWTIYDSSNTKIQSRIVSKGVTAPSEGQFVIPVYKSGSIFGWVSTLKDNVVSYHEVGSSKIKKSKYHLDIDSGRPRITIE